MGNGPTTHPSIALRHFYDENVDEVKQSVMAARGNVYGFLFENNSASTAVFIQVFDKVVADVNVGTTPADYTFKLLAGGTFGRNPQDWPIHYHSRGLTIAVTSTRDGATAPASPATIHFWTKGEGE
jgi:hypothetical protein